MHTRRYDKSSNHSCILMECADNRGNEPLRDFDIKKGSIYLPKKLLLSSLTWQILLWSIANARRVSIHFLLNLAFITSKMNFGIETKFRSANLRGSLTKRINHSKPILIQKG